MEMVGEYGIGLDSKRYTAIKFGQTGKDNAVVKASANK